MRTSFQIYLKDRFDNPSKPTEDFKMGMSFMKDRGELQRKKVSEEGMAEYEGSSGKWVVDEDKSVGIVQERAGGEAISVYWMETGRGM